MPNCKLHTILHGNAKNQVKLIEYLKKNKVITDRALTKFFSNPFYGKNFIDKLVKEGFLKETTKDDDAIQSWEWYDICNQQTLEDVKEDKKKK